MNSNICKNSTSYINRCAQHLIVLEITEVESGWFSLI